MTASTFIYLALGLILLVGGAELMVRGAARLAVSMGISSLVVGLTVVAFGTSAPELAVSVVSSYRGQADLAIGNVVGSNIFNILVILGLSATIIPLVVAQQLVRLDVPFMIGVSCLMLALGFDGKIGLFDGILLFSLVVGYTVFLIRQSRREGSESVKTEYENEFGPNEKSTSWLKNTALVAAGIAGLILGSRWLVDGAVAIARSLEISELVIGLTVIAVGTSLPEVATSVVAAIRGERDIAVGNAVGSNIFNILCVLGLSSIVSPAGIPVPEAAKNFDIPIMIAVAIACLPIFFNNYQISRANGIGFLGIYLAYLIYLILHASAHPWLDGYRDAMLWFVLPLSCLSLTWISIQAIRSWKSGPPPNQSH